MFRVERLELKASVPSPQLLWKKQLCFCLTNLLRNVVILMQVLFSLPFYSEDYCHNILKWLYPVALALECWARFHCVTYLLTAKLANISLVPPLLQGSLTARQRTLMVAKVPCYWSGNKKVSLKRAVPTHTG